MNPLFKPTPKEAELIDTINRYNNYEFSLIRMTDTMLEKSIIDASGQIRDILVNTGIVDYNELKPGGDKIYQKAIVLKNDIHEKKSSYYRPLTKKGDPRFWIYGLKEIVAKHTLVYFTVLDKDLIAIPLIETDNFEDLLKEIFSDPAAENALVKLKQLLILVKDAGWITSVSPDSNAPKDVGETLEHFLGVPINNLKTPDFLGKIELKSKREKAGTMDSLFSRVPEWDISNYQSVYDIVNTFGYVNEGDNVKRLYNDIKSTPNKQGLYLLPDDQKSILFQNYKKDEREEDVCAWRYGTIKAQLYDIHPSTLWVGAQHRIVENEYQFKYVNFELTSRPLFAEFITLIKTDKIIYDWKARLNVKGKGVRNHGPGFRIKPAYKQLLFKELIDLS